MTQTRSSDTLYINDDGRVTCREHAGSYLAAALNHRPAPSGATFPTPLGTWEAFPADVAHADGLDCETCSPWWTLPDPEGTRMANILWALLIGEELHTVGTFQAVHDHCDANDLILDAFTKAYGREWEATDQADIDQANAAVAIVDGQMRRFAQQVSR